MESRLQKASGKMLRFCRLFSETRYPKFRVKTAPGTGRHTQVYFFNTCAKLVTLTPLFSTLAKQQRLSHLFATLAQSVHFFNLALSRQVNTPFRGEGEETARKHLNKWDL
jgi:hypothetical protein